MNPDIMAISCNDNTDFDIQNLLSRNSVAEVAQVLKTNPRLVLDNPDLIERARTSVMVETLLGRFLTF